MSQISTPANKTQSLKEILAILRETYDILYSSDGRLGYLATNAPQDEVKTEKTQGENATLDGLSNLAINLRRKATDISNHTNIIVGS